MNKWDEKTIKEMNEESRGNLQISPGVGMFLLWALKRDCWIICYLERARHSPGMNIDLKNKKYCSINWFIKVSTFP